MCMCMGFLGGVCRLGEVRCMGVYVYGLPGRWTRGICLMLCTVDSIIFISIQYVRLLLSV